jgi:hypothetical protein
VRTHHLPRAERSFLGLVTAGVLLKDVQFVCLAMQANAAHHAEVTFDSIINISSRERYKAVALVSVGSFSCRDGCWGNSRVWVMHAVCRAFALPGDIVQVSMRVLLPLESGTGGNNAYVFVEASDEGRRLQEVNAQAPGREREDTDTALV